MPEKLIELIKQGYIKYSEKHDLGNFNITPEETTLKSWLLGGNEDELDDEGEIFSANHLGVPDQEVKDDDDVIVVTKDNIKTNLSEILSNVEKEKCFALQRNIFLKKGLSIILADGEVWDLVIFEVKPKYVDEVKQLVGKIPDLLIDDNILEHNPNVFSYYGGECNFYQEDGKLFVISGTSC